MKKILWLSHLLPYPPKAGVLLRSYNLLKEVSKNHEITLIAFNQKSFCPDQKSIDDAVEHLSEFCKVHKVIEIESDLSKWNKIALPIKSLAPWTTYTIKWMQSKEYKKAVNDLIASETFDVIHVDTLSLIPYVEKAEVKKVLNHHNIESTMMLRRAEKEPNLAKKAYFWQEGIKLRRYEQKKCSLFNLNVTCSNLDSERLKCIAPGIECTDIPNGVDLEYFRPLGKPVEEGRLIFAGGLSWYPNIDAIKYFVREVWPTLKKKVPNVSLTIIGRNPPEWLTDLATRDKSINVTGFVDDVRPYLDSAHIYVCPIRDGGGTKLKILDALAMGKPLVADTVACEGIDVENRENVLFAQSPESYINAIQEIMANRGLCEQLKTNARALAEKKYSFKKIGLKLSHSYENL